MSTTRVFGATALILVLLFAGQDSAHGQQYVLIGWNDLGMHCSNQDFSKVVVLPPFNNVSAQLIENDSAGLPRLVTTGFTVEYSIPGNTTSAGKTNFWTYAQQLFGLGAPLPQDVGLTGNGLTGVLTASGSIFSVTGIPVTPFQDSDLVHEAPYQLIHLVAKRISDGAVVATTDAVIPVSNEVGCVQSGCHSSEDDILNEHETVAGFNRSGPVLCASCHASNALGTAGIPEARPFSYRMHQQHRESAGPAWAIATCYKCHPGPNTQCLRDVMGRAPVDPLVCQDCHGTMDSVALSIDAGRRPWFDEPQCGACHGATYAEDPGKLFRMSAGHGGLMCSACHGSPHAILPTVQGNDNVQNVRLQGYAGTLEKCSVCHWMHQSAPGPHGILDTSVVAPPEMAAQVSPADGLSGVTAQPTLEWLPAAGAQGYDVEAATDAAFGAVVWSDSALADHWVRLPALAGGSTYYWRVRSRNSAGVSGWSGAWSFTTASGATELYTVNKFWNLVSAPMTADNPRAAALFPSAVSPAYSFDPVAGYATRETLATGAGYWMRFDHDQAVAITGVPVPAETIGVVQGWNLIGSVSSPLSWLDAQSSPPGIIASDPFAYNDGYELAHTIFPARGYWVKATAPGTLVLSATGAADPSTRPAAPGGTTSTPLAFIAVTITDAAGRSIDLLVADRPVGTDLLSRYEMPPVPPKGAFDVRFDTESMAAWPAGRPGGRAEIQILSARYPVTVAWESAPRQGTLSLDVGGNLIPMDARGSVEMAAPAALAVVGRVPAAEVPEGYALEQNAPNPFNPSTSIVFTVPAESRVDLGVYNMLGELVVKLVDRTVPEGTHTARWEPGNLPAGVYFCRFEAAGAGDPSGAVRLTRKMLYLK